MRTRGRGGVLAFAIAIAIGGAAFQRADAAPCVGDCDGDGTVTINELITGVTVALGGAPVSACAACDRNGDGAITVEELIVAVTHALLGCQTAPTPTATPGSPTRTPTRTPTMSTTLELFDVGANFFSIRKPKGWEVHIGGVCSTLGILLRDPAVPMRQAFYFGLIGPVYLKEAQRQIDQAYIDGGGYNFITWLDAPAVDPLTAENFFAHWPRIAAMKAAREFLPEFPPLTDLTAVTTTPQSSVFPGGDAALVRGVFRDGEAVGQGQWLGTTWVFMPFTGVPGGGTGYGSIILGVTAPMRELQTVEATLIASLDSFTVTQAYIDWCRLQSSQLWGAVAQAGRTLSETSDLIAEGWQQRTQASDILAEQRSDTLRSVERVYDPSTRQVYEVPLGWYDAYDTHRGNYSLDDLQLLPSNDYGLWTSLPADGGQIH
ncbi:hypothetical protein KF840_03865 [bacterium]|nr:hypothetical protein [bacterium]